MEPQCGGRPPADAATSPLLRLKSLQLSLGSGRYVRRPGSPYTLAIPSRGRAQSGLHARMSSTLIVRDATLAINGAPEARGPLREHLEMRVEEVAALPPQVAGECCEVLRGVAGNGEDADPEVLEALTTLALAKPSEAERLGISAIASGRRLAARFEQDNRPDDAIGLLELLLESFPGSRAVERDLQAVMRRQGMVQNLVQSYLARAKALLREGKNQEAIGWMREVLLLDRSRKDVARMIRDLRLQEKGSARPTAAQGRVVLLVMALLACLAYVGLREKRLHEEFVLIPAARSGDLESMHARLSALERFASANPIWHKSLMVVAERSDLRIEVDRLQQRETLRLESEAAKARERAEAAELARERGLMRAADGNYEQSLADFRQALELAADDWEHRERVERDVAALIRHLEQEGQEPPAQPSEDQP